MKTKSRPCQRSLAKLRKEGWVCAITEHWNSFTKRRVDLWGFCDILAMAPSRGLLAVQTTTAAHVAARLEKITAEPRAGIALASGVRIVVHGWALRGPRGGRKTWECREEWVESTSHETTS